MRQYDLKSSETKVIPYVFDFLDLLDKLDIKATFFVLGEIAKENSDILRDIVDRGHSIGCHGLDHRLLYEKDNETFFLQITRAKEIIKKACGSEISGYRASCFSMERDKLDIVQKSGFLYDSSKITFSQHPLYRNLDLAGFEKIDDLICKNGEFLEYEIPTVKLFKYDIPISGGGYLRLFPLWLLKILLKVYQKHNDNFLIYVHPFELCNIKLPLPKGLGFIKRFRCEVGRKRNLEKLKKLMIYLKKQGAEFRSLDMDCKLRCG